MKQYILKLTSGTSYRLYQGSTLVSDTDLTALFATAGSAYFDFDFDGNTPSSTDTLQVVDSNSVTVMSNTGVTVAEGKNYKGSWSNAASTFDDFVELSGKALDESQLSFLMRKIKDNTETLEDAAYIGSTLSTPSDVAYVREGNIVDGAVTVNKIDTSTFYDVLYDGTSVTGDVTLSDDPAKYVRLTIYGVTSDILQFSYDVYGPVNGNIFSISVQNLNSGGCWIKSARYTIDSSNNKLVKDIYRSGEYTAPVGSSTGSINIDTTYIRIKKVIGWKF